MLLQPCVPRQVNAEGSEHGVTPLAAACNAVHIMEQPTLFLGALWLPYRRNRQELTEAIAAAGPVEAVFCHADVVGGPPSKNSWPGSVAGLQELVVACWLCGWGVMRTREQMRVRVGGLCE